MFPICLSFGLSDSLLKSPRGNICLVLVATMLPYSLTFLVVWTLLLVLWLLAGWPLGPGAPLFIGRT